MSNDVCVPFVVFVIIIIIICILCCIIFGSVFFLTIVLLLSIITIITIIVCSIAARYGSVCRMIQSYHIVLGGGCTIKRNIIVVCVVGGWWRLRYPVCFRKMDDRWDGLDWIAVLLQVYHTNTYTIAPRLW